jgi:glycosyltransferase involved in cell wall biosynthesis
VTRTDDRLARAGRRGGPAAVDVVICAHNAAPRLPPLFSALASQTLAADRWGILLIDNASTDRTASVARELWQREDVELRVEFEPTPGQNHARRLARLRSTREFICFVDDDNLLAPEYLERALSTIEANPRIGALGGLGDAVSDVEFPPWFAEVAGSYAVGPQAAAEGDVPAKRGYVYGAGMVTRRSAWDELVESGFTTRLSGRAGTRLGSGDDNEFCLALALTGWRIYYSPRLRFTHCIAPGRLRPDYCLRLYRGFGHAMVVLNAYRDFLLGRARPDRWRWWSRMRAMEMAWLAAKTHVRGGPEHRVGHRSLRHEIEAGRAERYRDGFRAREMERLYASIAGWLRAYERSDARSRR